MKISIIIAFLSFFGLVTSAQTFSISGNIDFGSKNTIVPNGFGIVLKNIQTNDSIIQPIKSNRYIFDNVEQGYNYILFITMIESDNRCLSGVSTLDLVMIQRHILGISPFENTFQKLAADVSGDNKISTFDLFLLRQLILGFTPQFKNCWLSKSKADLSNEKIEIDQISNDLKNQDFVIIKTGDVNGNAF